MMHRTWIATLAALLLLAGACSDDSASDASPRGATDELGFTEITRAPGDAILLRSASDGEDEVRLGDIVAYCADYRIVHRYLEEWVTHVEAGDRDLAARLVSQRGATAEDAGGRVGTNATDYVYGVRGRTEVKNTRDALRRGATIEDLQYDLETMPPFDDLADFERVYAEHC